MKEEIPIIFIPSVKERAERLQKVVRAIEGHAGGEYILMTYINKPVGTIKVMLRMIERLSDDALVLQMNDDQFPVTKNFIPKLIKSYREAFGREEGIIQPDDAIHNGKMATIPFTTAGYLKKYFYNGYKSFFVDTELTEIAKARGEFIYNPDVRIEHRHWMVGTGEKDGLNESQMKYFEEDKKMFQERCKNSGGFTSLARMGMNYDGN